MKKIKVLEEIFIVPAKSNIRTDKNNWWDNPKPYDVEITIKRLEDLNEHNR